MAADNTVDVWKGIEHGEKLLLRGRRPNEFGDTSWAAVHHRHSPACKRELDAPGHVTHPPGQVCASLELLRDMLIPVLTVFIALTVLGKSAAAVLLAHADT